MAERIRIENIGDLRNKAVFFDANIWMYLFCPLGNSSPAIIRAYSRGFAKMNKANPIFTDLTVLSEFINRYLRMAGNEFKIRNNLDRLDYKRDFRGTTEYREALSEVYSTVKNRILKSAKVHSTLYSNDSITELLDEKELELDFNDQHITKVCQDNGFYLVSHDGDFKGSDINIVSFNRRFFES